LAVCLAEERVDEDFFVEKGLEGIVSLVAVEAEFVDEMSEESGAVTAEDFLESGVAAVTGGMACVADIGPVSGRPLTSLI
jgi:hypothetical protein